MAKIEMTEKSVKIDGVDIAGSLTAMKLCVSAARRPLVHLDMALNNFETMINGDILIDKIKMPNEIKDKILRWAKKELNESF